MKKHNGKDAPHDGTPASPEQERALFEYARLVSDMIHDFRTQLGSIVGSASVLETYSGSLDETMRAKLCSGIIDQAHRLDRLFAALGTIARVRAGNLIREERAFELNEILHGLSSRMRDHPEQPLDIAVQPQEIFLETDPDAVQAMLLLMLDLAYVFAAEESPVAVSVSNDGQSACVRVASAVHTGNTERLQNITGEHNPQPAEGIRASVEAVFLAAIREVVHSLGGNLTINHSSDADHLYQDVRLPKQTVSSGHFNRGT